VEHDQIVIKKELGTVPGFVQLLSNRTGSFKMVLVCDVRVTARRANPYRCPYSGRATLGKGVVGSN